jgi:hypothetical protein
MRVAPRMPPGAASLGRFENVMEFVGHGKILDEREQSSSDRESAVAESSRVFSGRIHHRRAQNPGDGNH